LKASIVALFASFINTRHGAPSSHDDNKEGNHLEVTRARKLALPGTRAAWREQAGHGTLLGLAEDAGEGPLQQCLVPSST